MRDLRCYMKPYIQPFERELALAELSGLSGAAPTLDDPAKRSTPWVYTVSSVSSPDDLRYRLAYWEVVDGQSPRPTRQVLREATSNGVKINGTRAGFLPGLPSKFDLPHRRCLRYGTHGLHEYRGKFFPQLVRALLNLSGVEPEASVLDPMCGSGTTLIEAVLGGHPVYGLDLNPLSVFMAKVKSSLLSADPASLEAEFNRVNRWLVTGDPPRESDWRSANSFQGFADDDLEYLARWFHASVLRQLGQVLDRIHRVSDEYARDCLRLMVSNILREISWQKSDDLRVRRDTSSAPVDVKAALRRELDRHSRTLLQFLRQERSEKWRHGTCDVKQGDARNLTAEWSMLRGQVGVIITSPPYATALPYIDTDRLSLIILGLLPRSEHRDRERDLIGHREITERLRRSYWQEYWQNRRLLPSDLTTVVEEIKTRNEGAKVGFRRRNLPALLGRYFLDMQKVFQQALCMLRPGGKFYVVVGSNRTVAGGKRIEIQTPTLLCQLASLEGFKVSRRIPMDMLTSRDIFRNNAIPREEILELTPN